MRAVLFNRADRQDKCPLGSQVKRLHLGPSQLGDVALHVVSKGVGYAEAAAWSRSVALAILPVGVIGKASIRRISSPARS